MSVMRAYPPESCALGQAHPRPRRVVPRLALQCQLSRDRFPGWPEGPQRRDLRLSVFKRGQRATIIAPAEAALAVSPVRRTQLKGGGNFDGRSCRGVWGPALARRPRRILKGPIPPPRAREGDGVA